MHTPRIEAQGGGATAPFTLDPASDFDHECQRVLNLNVGVDLDYKIKINIFVFLCSLKSASAYTHI